MTSRVRGWAIVLAVLATGLVGGCRSFDPPSGVLSCSAPPKSACPSGYVCRHENNKCYKAGDDSAIGGQGGRATGMAGSGGGSSRPDGSSGPDVPASTGGSGSTPDGSTSDTPQGPPTCSAEQKLCNGTCVAISDPTYGCGATTCDGSSCPNAAGATLACQAGACVISNCSSTEKKCGGQCVALTDPKYGCGPTTCDASACPNPGTGGTVACQSGACVIATCPADFKKCGNKCVAVADPSY